MVSRELLEILVCPETKAPLVLDQAGNLVSTDKTSRRRYRVENDIPVMLVEESDVLTEAEHAEVMTWAASHPA